MAAQFQWLTPSPLWNEFASYPDKTAFRSPALLRFATDSFMEDLQGLLAKTPTELRNYIAQGETWRTPTVGLGPVPTASAAGGGASLPASNTATSLKLFQPVHSRFYLVTASLACRLPGLPDHTVKTNQGEKTSFVVRRLQLKLSATRPAGSPFDTETYEEYAWSTAGPAPGWIIADAGSLAAGEEQQPLFSFQFGSNGSQRRVFSGLIPVGKRESYVAGRTLAAQQDGTVAPSAPDDPRKIDFQRQVLDPWADLVDQSGQPDFTQPASLFAAAQGSAYILIDFANYLSANLNDVWRVVSGDAQPSSLSGTQSDLFNAMSATMGVLPPGVSRFTLAQAIKMAKAKEDDFDNQVLTPGSHLDLPAGYPGPMLTDETDLQLAALIGRPNDPSPVPQRKIQSLVEAALDQAGPPPASSVPSPAKDPQNPQGNDWYIVRCVYERPQCAVKTLPSVPIISLPSLPFQLASYFDPDAPARMTQVALPVDTTPAALRKYPKGVAFMISDQLGQQMQRVKGLKELMDGDIADSSGFGLGMICSLSIPIITICAFLVLMIFLVLLNIIFFWLPFFKICFPIPTLKAKGS